MDSAAGPDTPRLFILRLWADAPGFRAVLREPDTDLSLVFHDWDALVRHLRAALAPAASSQADPQDP